VFRREQFSELAIFERIRCFTEVVREAAGKRQFNAPSQERVRSTTERAARHDRALSHEQVAERLNISAN
jgi:hypothetical protein